MIKSIVQLCALAVLVLTANSCKLIRHKRGKKQKEKAAIETRRLDSLAQNLKQSAVDTTLSETARLDSFSGLRPKPVDLNTLSAKAKIHYEGGDKSLDFVANIRMRKDSIIWVSVSAGGGIIQVARAIITPDSFHAVSYLDKQAFSGPISKAAAILPEGIDFYSLQNMILGNPILKAALITSVADSNDRFVIGTSLLSYLEQLEILKADTALVHTQLISMDSSNRSLSQSLSQFALFGTKRLAQERHFHIINNGEGMLVDMNLSNIVIDAEQRFPFSVPEGYTQR